MDYYIIFLFYMQSLIYFFYIYKSICMYESKYTILHSIICADYMIIQFISFIYVCTTLYQ